MNTPASKPNQPASTSPAAESVSATNVSATQANVAPLKVATVSSAAPVAPAAPAAASMVMPKPSAPYGTPAKAAPGLVTARPASGDAKKAVEAAQAKPKVVEAAKPASVAKANVTEKPQPSQSKASSMDKKVEKADGSNMVNASVGIPSFPVTGMMGNMYDNQMQVFKMVQNMFTNVDEISAMGKANAEAVLKSTQIVAKGFEELSKAMFGFAQTSVQQTVDMGQAYAGVKTLKDLTDLQKQNVQKSFDSMIAEGTKISEMSVKVANDALEPLSARINELMSKVSKSA